MSSLQRTIRRNRLRHEGYHFPKKMIRQYRIKERKRMVEAARLRKIQEEKRKEAALKASQNAPVQKIGKEKHPLFKRMLSGLRKTFAWMRRLKCTT